jgi:hypothetical protein
MIRLFGLGEKTKTTAQDAVLVERVLGIPRTGAARQSTAPGHGSPGQPKTSLARRR